MTRLLIPTDFSNESENAINYAIMVSKTVDVEMILLHSAVPDYVTILYKLLASSHNNWEDEANQQLQTLKAHIEKQGNIAVKNIITEEPLEQSLKQIAQDEKIDYIIMGTKGTAGSWIREVLGSTTSKIVSSVNLPVIVIPATYKVQSMNKITFATDYHPGDLKVLSAVTGFARAFNAHIQVIHFAEKVSHEAKERMREFIKSVNGHLAYNNISYEVVGVAGIKYRIHEHFAALESDLTVLSKTQRYIWDLFNYISVSKELTEHTQKPVLIFHHAAQPLVLN